MADEMPIQRSQIRQLLLFAGGFLQSTFTEAALPQLNQFTNGGSGLALAHRQ
jgi:hypothetical protein